MIIFCFIYKRVFRLEHVICIPIQCNKNRIKVGKVSKDVNDLVWCPWFKVTESLDDTDLIWKARTCLLFTTGYK